MSSRKSNSSKKHMNNSSADIQIPINGITNVVLIVTTVVVVLYHLLILGYIYTLEDKMCNCIRDWRHDFIKYFSMAMIVYAILILVLTGTAMRHNMIMNVICCSILVLSFVNVLCLFTYIGDLESSQCMCAIEKQKMMHYFLYVWRYILVIALVVKLISIIMSAMV
jgi:hypothetical protein